MKRWTLSLLILLIAALSACSSATEPPAAAATELIVSASDIAFDTNRLEAIASRPVRVTLSNTGALEHDFSIMKMPHIGAVMDGMAEGMDDHDMSHMGNDPDVHVAAMTGNSHSIEFTPSEPGEYEYFCSVPGHKEAGMVGTLVVKAP